MSNLWTGRHVCLIITGASRGLGRQLAITFADNFVDYHRNLRSTTTTTADDYSLSYVLLSRDAPALQDLSHQLSAIDGQHVHTVDIICGSLDDPITIQSFERTCDAIAADQRRPYDQIVCVHNAGSLGDINQLTADYGVDNGHKVGDYLALNLTSVMQMTGIFLRLFKDIGHKTLINITSLAAVSAFKGLSLYCIGKASRDAFFRSVALENESVRVLSYAPGPLETNMVDVLRTDGFLRQEFAKMDVLKPETTVRRLIQILEDNKFKSGDHIDYYQPFSP